MRPRWRRERPDFDTELRHHLEESTELLVAQGWTEEEARREAERRFGDSRRVRRRLGRIHRHHRIRRALEGWLTSTIRDARYAIRTLWLNGGVTFAVVLTLGLGVAMATSVFTVVDAALLRPIEYEDADRWTEVLTRSPSGSRNGLSTERYQGWTDAGDTFADAWLGFTRETVVRSDGVAGEPLSALWVTPGARRLLGLPLLMGRGFDASDTEVGGPAVAVLSRAFYERLGADPEILGGVLRLEHGPTTVVGVLRGGVKFPARGPPVDLWLPIRRDLTVQGRELRELRGFQSVWARLAPELDFARAQERADATAAALQSSRPLERGWEISLRPVGWSRTGDERPLGVLAATVVMLLAIAVANGVNLLLVRATGRSREFAVRIAMGGSRGELLRQLILEGVILGALAAGMAVGLAWLSLEAMQPLLPSGITWFSPHVVDMDERALSFAAVVSILAGVVMGVVPWIEVARSRAELPGPRGSDDPPRLRRLRKVLVAGQVAMSAILLVGTALFLQSITTLVAEDPGFDFQHVALARIELPSTRYERADRREILRRIEDRVESHGSVTGLTYTTGTGFSFDTFLQPESGDIPQEQPELIPFTAVPPDYLETVGAEIVAGRPFREADRDRYVAVIDQDLATLLWGTDSPVGRRFRKGEDGRWLEVVGVVRELRLMGRDQRSGPHQFLEPTSEEGPGSYVELVVRTSDDPTTILPELRRAIGEVDPMIPIHDLRTGSEELASEEDDLRFLATLMSILGASAVLLASVGLYGVLAYSVRRRDRELGVRMALGANGRRVLAMVLRDGMTVTVAGLILGLIGASWLSAFAASLLYEVEPRDPVTMALTGGFLLLVALTASLLPARRAVQVDPAATLRNE